MNETERGNARIVHAGAGGAPRCEQLAQPLPVPASLGEQNERRSLQPGIDLLERALERGRGS